MKGGTLTAIAHSAKERLSEFPEVPTLKEQGYDIVSTTWYALSGPANLPDDMVQKLNRAVAEGMAMPEAEQQRLKQNGLINEAMSVAEFHKFIDSEITRWKPVVEQAGLVEK